MTDREICLFAQVEITPSNKFILLVAWGHILAERIPPERIRDPAKYCGAFFKRRIYSDSARYTV